MLRAADLGLHERSAVMLATLPVVLALSAQAAAPEVPDCRHPPWAASDEGGKLEKTLLPANDLFAPPLAGPRERRFYAAYLRFVFDGHAGPTGEREQAIDAGSVAAGANFGLWGMRSDGCDGLQINLSGGIFSEFDLSSFSQNLINTDFLVGVPFTFRWKALSGRLRLYHMSSHLGDEFLLANPRFERFDFSFEALDLLLSWDAEHVRVYGGGGVIVHQSIETSLDPLMFRAGFESRYGLREPWGATYALDAVLGVDLQLLQERDFGVTASIKGGIDLTHRLAYSIRILLTYLGGYVPFGQFTISQTINTFGVEGQLEF